MEIPMNFISLKSSDTKTYFPFEILQFFTNPSAANNTVAANSE